MIPLQYELRCFSLEESKQALRQFSFQSEVHKKCMGGSIIIEKGNKIEGFIHTHTSLIHIIPDSHKNYSWGE